MEQLASLVNANKRLVWRGRYVDTAFLLEVGDEAWLVKISAGRVASVTRVGAVRPSWTFALRAAREHWQLFWQADPKPGYQDLLAMVKKRTLSVEGDLYPFMSNLLYFKELMASLRGRLA
ncbi:MAG: hypothetical protein FJY56_17420 [Betaproteobacteria bacterium]|nr:hypothetical protein [Betaproteobacteria bacterium]